MGKKKSEAKLKVGDRIDKLEIIKKVDIPIETKEKDENGNTIKVSTGKTKEGWLCKCDCGEFIKLTEKTLLTERNTLRSCNKCLPEKNPNYIPKKMTYESNQEWEELFEYVKKDIFGYNEDQKMPEYIIVRLLGLSRGKHIANNKSVNNANYSYKTVLNTFKFCSIEIENALRTVNFKDEKHKANYIFKIIDQKINDVYIRMQNAEKTKEKTESIDMSYAANYVNTFKKRERKVNNRLKDLW